MKRGRLKGSFPAKVAAVFLLTVFFLTAVVFCLAAFGAYLADFYRAPGAMSFDDAVTYRLREGYIQDEDYTMFIRHPLFAIIYNARYAAIPLAVTGLVLFIITFIFLMCAAGHRNDREGIVLGFFDAIPFDLVLGAAGFAVVMLIYLISDASFAWWADDLVIWALFIGGLSVLIMLVLVLTLYTFAARVKAGGWWRNTVVFFALSLLLKCVRYASRCVSRVAGSAVRLFRALRMEWRVGLAVVIVNMGYFLCEIWLDNRVEEPAVILTLFLFAASFCVLVFCANQFRQLRAAAEKLAAGELDYKVDTRRMYFDFRLHGEDLNSIGDGMSAAVEQRIKSERLKTELITNVSHDIKTPLTSIVNYVDLLQKQHTPEEEVQYLDVLKRQSDKLRRLTVDLVEASKASTGNLPTELAPTNTAEIINQAVAEYTEKFELCRLEPVVTCPEKPVTVLADGRHLWRVLDNLFNNTVKYSQPGTRVYVDVRQADGGAVISVKNISRDRLNLSSDELMERFVRGDSSRHTEGSGLGLSIARSLTELMGGHFDIVIDGDLFKASIWLKGGIINEGKETDLDWSAHINSYTGPGVGGGDRLRGDGRDQA